MPFLLPLSQVWVSFSEVAFIIHLVSHSSKILRRTAMLLQWLLLHAYSPAGEESP
jgi:hypothetical protein